tara:strand:- start:4601 stop:4852 length:252 start_codon:yes stop_codon:yes gene_type:complete
MEETEDNEKKGDLLNQLAIIADLTEKINLEVKNPTLLFELDVEEYDRVKDYLKTKYNDKIDDEGEVFSVGIGECIYVFSKSNV